MEYSPGNIPPRYKRCSSKPPRRPRGDDEKAKKAWSTPALSIQKIARTEQGSTKGGDSNGNHS